MASFVHDRYVRYCNYTIVIVTNMVGNLIVVGMDNCPLVHSCDVEWFEPSVLGRLVLGMSLSQDAILDSQDGLVSC
jgi:hypothetical protein